jgi:hypothetical protein
MEIFPNSDVYKVSEGEKKLVNSPRLEKWGILLKFHKKMLLNIFFLDSNSGV